ncbi:cupredoxin domain-containing protein [Frankia sp. CNm7]|uniref:Cupredoxin domain-containing protein n=1 Tax=Frankia nepalensis TaxID=1836974 RepID=A0A937RL07_9ACTN|nr:cupredoxin domain-containing protein [Frankia nepalensis]MBL7496243.1 cupredoxin domain-containing protein [Frankia nepalensis]MBL7515585.1 cupredoxin domain-containing protein [Frankia nepalensis]MBL7521257.1 cupredoxin domain-containing protein [Frankia nepalensis]MBL7632247.1 cupredoxin domain-containing protein [Frankia nepalensis]
MTGPAAARRRLAATALVALAVTGAGCAAEHPDSPRPTAVEKPTISDGVQVFQLVGMSNMRFSAGTLEAKPGKIRVDFSVEDGGASHNFDIPKLPGTRTGIVGAGGSQSVTFTVTEPGDYPVICTLHPNMSAVLRVS